MDIPATSDAIPGTLVLRDSSGNFSGGSGGGAVTLTGAVTGSGTGSIATTFSATGTANSTTFLRGDNTWAAPAGGGGVTDGDKGDITVSASGATWVVDNDAITYAKLQNVSATSRILGRKTAAAGDVEECTLSEILDFIGSSARGDILFRGASTWSRLAAGSSGQYLRTNGSAADPSYSALPVELVIACSDETTNLTTGTAKVTFRAPYAFTLTAVRASVNTAPTDSTLIVDINENGVSVLSTRLSIDASEKTSLTAASAAVISDSAIADDAEITIDIDQIGSTIPGKGLKVVLIGTRA